MAEAEGEERAVDAHWPHIPMFQSLQLCPSPKIPGYRYEDPVLEAAHHVVHVVPRKLTVKNTPPSAMAQPLPPQMKVAVVVAVLRLPVVVPATVPAVEKPLQLRLRPQRLLRYLRRIMFPRPRPRAWYLHRLVRVLWLGRS